MLKLLLVTGGSYLVLVGFIYLTQAGMLYLPDMPGRELATIKGDGEPLPH